VEWRQKNARKPGPGEEKTAKEQHQCIKRTKVNPNKIPVTGTTNKTKDRQLELSGQRGRERSGEVKKNHIKPRKEIRTKKPKELISGGRGEGEKNYPERTGTTKESKEGRRREPKGKSCSPASMHNLPAQGGTKKE